MKAKYELIYKNGHKDELIQEASNQEHTRMINTIKQGISNNSSGLISFHDEKKGDFYIQFSEIARVKFKIIKNKKQ